jgi:regulator of protease activity HflC (stomatin/prohibitin superfamily)
MVLLIAGFGLFIVVVGYFIIAIKSETSTIGYVRINQAQAMVIERFGSFHRVLDAGMHFIWPFMERAKDIQWQFPYEDPETKETKTIKRSTYRIDLRETTFDFPRQNAITKENVALDIDGLLYFQVINARQAVYGVANLLDAISKLSETTLRAVIGGMRLDDTLSEREAINRKIQESLDQATFKWGVRITRVELQDIKAPAELAEAMSREMEAERTKRAMVLTAEGERQAKIIIAEAEKQAMILKAEGEASARYRVAQAEAEAIRKLMEVLNSSESSTQYMTTIKYIDAFKHLIAEKSDKLIMMPYETSAVLSALEAMMVMSKNKTTPPATT